MLTVDEFFSNEELKLPKPKCEGRWFEIRLTPDVVAGEMLNIGVGFIDAKRKFHFKLLDSAAPFACLYGRSSREQFDFLLSTTRSALVRKGHHADISPHVTFGKPRYASGESVESILSRLYFNMVTLSRREIITDAKTPKSDTIDTPELRRQMYSAIKKRQPNNFSKFWRQEPISVQVDKVSHNLDMQVWVEETLLSPRVFGSVVSVHYKTDFYRKGGLDAGFRHLSTARQFATQTAKGALFILRPPIDTTNYPESLQSEIDNEIDDATWVLKKRFDISPYVADSVDSLTRQAMAFAF